MTSSSRADGSGFFDWVNRRIRLVTVVLVVGAMGFLLIGESPKNG